NVHQHASFGTRRRNPFCSYPALKNILCSPFLRCQKLDGGTKGATASEALGRIIMLENSKAFSGFAAPDIAKEKKFDSQTLGLKTVEGQWPAHIASGRRQ